MVNEATTFLPPHSLFSLRVKFFLDDKSEIPTCPICNDSPCYVVSDGSRISQTCISKECDDANKLDKAKKTSMERYGVESPAKSDVVKKRRVETNLRKYGAKSHTQTEEYKQKIRGRKHSDETRKKMSETAKRVMDERGDEIIAARKATNFERYGVEHASQNLSIQKKVKDTHTKRYGSHYLSSEAGKQSRIDAFGTENYFRTPEFQEKVKKHNMEKYGTRHHLQNPDALEKLDDREWLLSKYKESTIVGIAEEIGSSPSTVWNYLIEYGVEDSEHGASKVSQGERDLIEFLTEKNLNLVTSSRSIIPPLELDIYIPEDSLAIEFNGIFWHSERFQDRDYHQKKSLACMDKGIQLIHVWEDDWKDPNKREIIFKKIESKLGVAEKIYARKCKVVEPTTLQVREFYDRNHLQGFVRSTIHIGLEYEGSLVACISFHLVEDGEWDLTRYATSKTVVGGFTRLLTAFQRTNSWNKIVTFAHLDYSHGNVYEKAGFDKIRITPPGMWYTKGGVRERREKYMKSKLDDLLTDFDPSLTERENMHNHGFLRIYDAGSIRYELTNQ